MLRSLNPSPNSSSSHPTPCLGHALDKLDLQARPIAYPSKSIINLPESRLFLISQGILQLVTCYEDGQEAVLGIATSPSLVGTPLTQVQPYWAMSLTDVLLQPLSWEEIQNFSLLREIWSQNLLKRLQQSERLIAIAGQRRGEERLKQMFCLLAQDCGDDRGDCICLRMMLTHAQLATVTGSNRVTITRLVQKFKEAGWLTEEKRYYSISKAFLRECHALSGGQDVILGHQITVLQKVYTLCA